MPYKLYNKKTGEVYLDSTKLELDLRMVKCSECENAIVSEMWVGCIKIPGFVAPIDTKLIKCPFNANVSKCNTH